MGNHTGGPGESTQAFADKLLGIRLDADVRRLALRQAGSLDLAEDALSAAYCAVSGVREPARIVNFKSYFCRVLINEIRHLRTQLEEIPAGGLTDMSDLLQAPRPPNDGLEDDVHLSMFKDALFGRLKTHRNELLAAIPGRSNDLGHYRAVIYAVAEQVLRDGINGEPSDADSNDAFRAAHPEYFDQPGATPNLLHQRFRRARKDVKALLQTVVRRDELS